MKKVRRVLTGSRIDEMYALYKIVKEEFDSRNTDTMDFDELFLICMKKGKGRFNPMWLKEELEKI